MKRYAAVLLVAGTLTISISKAEPVPPAPESTTIVVQESADPVVKFAAQELGRYLERITGAPLPISKGQTGHSIYVGHVPPGLPPAAAEKLRSDLNKVREDGFIVRSVSGNLVIMGKLSRGTLYGCYAFLEHLGARWYFPGPQYEVIPRQALDWNAPVDLTESPSFAKRILFYWPHNYTPIEDWIDFSAKARLNRIMFHYTWPARDWYIDLRSRLLPELQKRGMEIEVAGHFLASFLPRTLHRDHPDWFRRNEQGNRVNDFNLNPFNADALDHLMTGAVKHLIQMPEADLFHLWADDIGGGGWSQEPGKEDYTPSDQALLVTNALAQRLRQDLPNANVAYLAYHDTVLPPRVVKPAPGVVFFYAPRERCYAHGLDDTTCSLNQKYARALEQALPSFGSGNAEVFEYYVDQILYENVTNPPIPDVLSADARYYGGLGIPAVGALMTNTSDFPTPMVNMFLYPQALWNAQRDLNASLAEYARLYFGDGKLDAYFRDLSAGVKSVLKICRYEHPGDAWNSPRVDKESDEALEYHVQGLEEGIRGHLNQAAGVLDEALRRSKGTPFYDRLAGEQLSMHFTIRQAKLHYHLLKGERLYRTWKQRGGAEAGLDVLAESVLARYSWERQKSFVARSGLKGSPLIPDPRPLEERAGELTGLVYRDAASASGLNPWGYSVDPLIQHLEEGLSGFIVAGPSGSKAVLWTDLKDSARKLPAVAVGISFSDEFGQPLKRENLDLANSPVIVEGKGIPAEKLFGFLARGQKSLSRN